MSGLGILSEASSLASRGEPFALATVVWREGPSSGKQGSRAIITASGELSGWIGGACAEPVVIREARQAIADGKPRLLLLGTAERFGGAVQDGMTVVPISCQGEGALEVYIEPVLPAPHLVIVGGSPMANVLARLARALDWAVDLVPGADFTTDYAAGNVSQRSMVVIATQGHGDEDMIGRAITARPAYLGLVGSRKRGAAVLGYLAERGLPRADLDRVHVPAGLDLGRTSHEEMAVAIIAELVQLRASGSLTESTLPASTPATTSASAVDPVCGMTVPADAAHWPLEHDEATYYFCCADCRQSYERDSAFPRGDDPPPTPRKPGVHA